MNRLTRLFLLTAVSVMCLGLLAGPIAQADDYNYARVVRLSLVDGQVQIAHAGADGWEQAVANMPVQQGDTIATNDGRVEIEFESGATARLAENSELQITELALSNGARITRLTLTQGTATFYANLANADAFTVETPGVHVSVPENSRFRVDAAAEGSVVTVWKGSVDVNSSAGTHRVSKGNTLSFQTNDPENVAIGRSEAPDAWDKWVADRDEAVQTATTQTLQYTSSSQYYPGMADLYSYGQWYQIPGYGMCWRPYGATLSWTPFMAGSWGYFGGGFGWTWVSYEPWGWLPYHYGGWFFDPAMGWVWCPSFNQPWRPATATFVHFGNRTGWVPLHPHDRPGQPPANLPRGVLLPNGNGLNGRNRHPMPQSSIAPSPTPAAQVVIPRNNKIDVLSGAPRDFAPGRVPPPAQAAVTAAVPTSPWKGHEGGRPSGTARITTPNAAPPPSSSAQPGIVYDQREHRWVNNPNAPAPPRPANAPAPAARPQQPPSQQAGPTPQAQPQRNYQYARPTPGSAPAGQSAPPPPPHMAPPPPPPAASRQMSPPPSAPHAAPPPPASRPMAPPPPPPHMAPPPPPPAQHMAPPPPPPAPHASPPAQSSPPPPPPPPKPHT